MDQSKPMDRLIFGKGVRGTDVSTPGQLFAFGSVVLHANSTGHLGRVDGFAPNYEIRF